MAQRDEFLRRIREAQPRHRPSLPARGNLAYQGGGDDALATFADRLREAGGQFHRADDPQAAVSLIVTTAVNREAELVLLDADPRLDQLGVRKALENSGIRCVGPSNREYFFEADLGVSSCLFLIAETGSIVVASDRQNPRSSSLLPPVHIAVAFPDQLIPDLFDLFDKLGPCDLPSAVSIITGPSKTGDIELNLVTGVHGPGEVHLLWINESAH